MYVQKIKIEYVGRVTSHLTATLCSILPVFLFYIFLPYSSSPRSDTLEALFNYLPNPPIITRVVRPSADRWQYQTSDWRNSGCCRHSNAPVVVTVTAEGGIIH